MNEDELEQLCLDWFRYNSWDVAYGPDISPDSYKPERSDYHEVVLKRYLHEALFRINPHMPENAIEQAMAVVLKPDSPNLT
ncbi:MAG: type I restriction endonuclease, partial [Methanosarcinales archaeon]